MVSEDIKKQLKKVLIETEVKFKEVLELKNKLHQLNTHIGVSGLKELRESEEFKPLLERIELLTDEIGII